MAADDAWLQTRIINGLQGLMALRLQGAPAEDTVVATARAWLAVLENLPHTWDEEQDAPRIRQGFVMLAGRVSRWPSPREFIDCLPPRPPRRSLSSPTSRVVPADARRFIDAFLGRNRG